MASLRYNLNRVLNGTNGVVITTPTTWLDEARAANLWAGTTGLDVTGALNQKAQTGRVESQYKHLQGILNELAGTTGLGVEGAADLLVASQAPLLNNSINGLATTTAITNLNSGGASGNAWDSVVLAATGAVTADNTHAFDGTVSTKYVAGATAGNTYTEWTTSLTGTSVASYYWRTYLWLTGVPTNTPLLVVPRSGASFAGGISVDTPVASPVLRCLDSTGTYRATGSVAIALNQWVRIEGRFVGNAAAGVVEAKLFNNPNSDTPDEVVTATGIPTVGALTACRFGFAGTFITGAQNSTIWMDDQAVSLLGYMGRRTS